MAFCFPWDLLSLLLQTHSLTLYLVDVTRAVCRPVAVAVGKLENMFYCVC